MLISPKAGQSSTLIQAPSMAAPNTHLHSRIPIPIYFTGKQDLASKSAGCPPLFTEIEA
jgi:hypothetical protein